MLYANSRAVPESGEESTRSGVASANPLRLLKGALRGVRSAAKSGVTAIGAVASEMAGDRVLQVSVYLLPLDVA